MKKILIVDDDLELLKLLNLYLTEFGYAVQVLESGEKVQEYITLFKPDLLLIDAMLAGMDGREICKTIKNETITHELPVILISVIPEMSRALDQPGSPDEFLVKPFYIDYLMERIEKHLEEAV